jgi:hypothetical protein
VKQAESIEIAYLINGEVISVRRLSQRGEWRSAVSTFGLVVAMSAAAALVVALALQAAHRVVYGPAYIALWFAIGVAVASLAAARAARRARSYTIGAGLDDDAFAAAPLPLVFRGRAGYRIALCAGFTGRIDGDRTSIPVESLAREVGARFIEVPLEPGARAEVGSGATTFVVRSLPEGDRGPALPSGARRRFVRRAFLPLELTALASIFCAVPVGSRIGEGDMKSAIAAHATPWEIEKALRAEAQTQASALHRCFDVLPISCQRSGYVGVGVSLSREGEIRSHWIARSTFGADCPVEQCMSDVVSNWFFEPIPESIRVVLPVQVLRTDRPLPYGAARAAADLERSSARGQGPVDRRSSLEEPRESSLN